jgi:hypothetical protein
MNEITLYHATSLGCYQSMIEKGYMGLDRSDYWEIATKIRKSRFIITDTLFETIFDSVYDSESDESNGGVSFFPTFEQCANIAQQYNEGGEWLNLFTKRFTKSAHRRTKTKYKEFSSVCLLGDTKPVVLQVELDKTLIANLDKVENSLYEHYTLEKVPSTCIKKCIIVT